VELLPNLSLPTGAAVLQMLCVNASDRHPSNTTAAAASPYK
jgi:hypothetical protein